MNGLREFLRRRFGWYSDICNTTTGYCLVVDFRDTYFQADPFRYGSVFLDGMNENDLVIIEEPMSISADTDFDAKVRMIGIVFLDISHFIILLPDVVYDSVE